MVKAAMVLLALDMVGSAVTGKKSYTEKTLEKTGIGDFTKKILAERENKDKVFTLNF